MDIGTIVISKAGRDKGRYAVVVGYDGYALIADGKERPLANPKRKNPKHITLTDQTVNIENLTDKQLRRLFSGRNNG
jgi:ribosomal protein L14E/L6E/L27E